MMISATSDKIAYCDLNRNFKLEEVTSNMILLSSVKHRILLMNSSSINVKYDWPYLIHIDPPFSVCPICIKEGEITSQYVCVKCYFKAYEKQERDRQLVEWVGKEYKICIEIYEKTQDMFCFQVANIEKIPCEWCDNMMACSVHNIHIQKYNVGLLREQCMCDLLNTTYMFIIHYIQWMNNDYMSEEPYIRDNIIAIRREFAVKLMLIRDFALLIPFDVWCYVVGLMIESEKTREIVFV